MNSIVPELCKALDQEIAELKHGRGGSRVALTNGRRLHQVDGRWIYEFTAGDTSAVIADDTPAQLHLADARYDATVISTHGPMVEILLDGDLGATVPATQLTISLWFLYEALRKKLAGNQDAARFRLSDAVFGLRDAPEPPSGPEPRYSPSQEPPNPSQVRAIEQSFRLPVCLIWGPPGTGKTVTVARAIEAHLNAGRRVLLVSHANNAVDEALERVARQLKDTPHYQKGQLVRLGIPREEKLAHFRAELPLVLEEGIAIARGAVLQREIERLRAASQGARAELEATARALRLVEEIATASDRAKALAAETDRAATELAAVASRLADKKQALAEAEHALNETLNATGLGGLVRRLGVGGQRRRVEDLRTAVNRTLADEERCRRRAEASRAERDRVANRLREARRQLAEAMQRLGGPQSDLARRHQAGEAQVCAADARIAELMQQIANLRKTILSEARLVATTLTKTYIAPAFPVEPFDVLVADEASMAPLPALYWAASRCRTHATIVGDFLQLPPIVVADADLAKRWLGRSIYDVLGITTVERADHDRRVVLLDTQYRMHPHIAGVANRAFYDGKLRDHPSVVERRFVDSVAERSLILVDTTSTGAWCTRLASGSRLNPTNATVAVGIARAILQKSATATVGIATPYAAQARFIQKLIEDEKLDRVRASTVHRFQGSELDVVVFDLTEGPGANIGRLTDDTRPDSSARLLLNVAITRAKHRLYVVSHVKHLEDALPPHAKVREVLTHLESAAQLMPPSTFLSALDSGPASGPHDGEPSTPDDHTFFDATRFWPRFIRDVEVATGRLIIESAYITARRWADLAPSLRQAADRGVKTTIMTKPPEEHGDRMADEARRVIAACASLGISVVERPQMHEKLAIIDARIAWHGSLNILSHGNTTEMMARLTGASVAELDRIAQEHARPRTPSPETRGAPVVPPTCPACGRPMVRRTGKRGPFWGCTGFATKQCSQTLPYP